MCKTAIPYLKYLGSDSWDRLVYEDDNGVPWKDIGPRVDKKGYAIQGL